MPAIGMVTMNPPTMLTVTAYPWPGGWELHLPGGGVTQCHAIHEDGDFMVRGYLLAAGRREEANAIIIINSAPRPPSLN